MELKSCRLEVVKAEKHLHPSSHCMPLSNLDQMAAVTHIPYLFAFPSKPDNDTSATSEGADCSDLRKSLAKLLEEFFPLSGRLTLMDNGKIGVDCSNAGVDFYEAEATGTLMDLVKEHQEDAFTERNALISPLRRRPSTEEDNMPLLIQVTSFECGGVVLLLAMHHRVSDGQFFNFFLKRWVQVHRSCCAGDEGPHFWHEVLNPRVPLTEIYTPSSEAYFAAKFVPAGCISSKVISLTSDMIDRLRRRAVEDGCLERPTRFETVASHLWRCFAKARKLHPSRETRLQFPVDARRRFSPPVPEGLWGNVSTGVTVACRVDDIPHSASALIRRGSQSVNQELIQSIIDGIEAGAHPSAAFGLENEFTVTSWWGFPYCSLDFGWGKPSYVAPAFLVSKDEELPTFALAILLPCPDPSQVSVFIDGLVKDEMETMERCLFDII